MSHLTAHAPFYQHLLHDLKQTISSLSYGTLVLVASIPDWSKVTGHNKQRYTIRGGKCTGFSLCLS